MTIEELKNKYNIIDEIIEEYSEDNTYYSVIFILGSSLPFDTLEEVNEYCTRVENILKGLKLED